AAHARSMPAAPPGRPSRGQPDTQEKLLVYGFCESFMVTSQVCSANTGPQGGPQQQAGKGLPGPPPGTTVTARKDVAMSMQKDAGRAGPGAPPLDAVHLVERALAVLRAAPCCFLATADGDQPR